MRFLKEIFAFGTRSPRHVKSRGQFWNVMPKLVSAWQKGKSYFPFNSPLSCTVWQSHQEWRGRLPWVLERVSCTGCCSCGRALPSRFLLFSSCPRSRSACPWKGSLAHCSPSCPSPPGHKESDFASSRPKLFMFSSCFRAFLIIRGCVLRRLLAATGAEWESRCLPPSCAVYFVLCGASCALYFVPCASCAVYFVRAVLCVSCRVRAVPCKACTLHWMSCTVTDSG